MITLKSIEEFLASRKFAIVGVSTNPKKFGYRAYQDLKKKGFSVYPVNPKTDKINGEKCYPDISSLPGDVSSALIITPRTETEKIVEEAANKGIKHIWIQQQAETSEAIEKAKRNNIEVIHNKCILMFAEPVTGLHKFHRFFIKLFGKFPI